MVDPIWPAYTLPRKTIWFLVCGLRSYAHTDITAHENHGGAFEGERSSLLRNVLNLDFAQSVFDLSIVGSSAERQYSGIEQAALDRKRLLLKSLLVLLVSFVAFQFCIGPLTHHVQRRLWIWEIAMWFGSLIGAYGVFLLFMWL